MFQTLLAELAPALDGAGIPCMVIGGQVVFVHGEPRQTRDTDVTRGVDRSALAASAAPGLASAVPNVKDVVAEVRSLKREDQVC